MSRQYIIAHDFRDKDNYSIAYHKGEAAGHFDPDRLSDLIKKGLVKEYDYDDDKS